MRGKKINLEKLREQTIDMIKASLGNSITEDELYLKTELFLSSICKDLALHSFEEVIDWINYWRNKTTLKIEKIPIKECRKWYTDEKTGNIHHESGQFFSVVGLRAYSEDRELAGWDQPILEQPEIGILGILVKKINGVFHFLMQAKEEPGNIDKVHISPTLQATRSNYTRVHGGKLPEYFDIFDKPGSRRILYSKLQSEEGGRFLLKNNLNVLIELNEDEINDPPGRFKYLTLYQINKLMMSENIVNSCARSVLSCLL
ncbi:MAG: NDP-hexose 2,3-dehydratase family protein [Candidatus Omnitrophota bacterium]